MNPAFTPTQRLVFWRETYRQQLLSHASGAIMYYAFPAPDETEMNAVRRFCDRLKAHLNARDAGIGHAAGPFS